MTSSATVLIALLASAVRLQGLTPLSGEESSGRLGLVLSARLPGPVMAVRPDHACCPDVCRAVRRRAGFTGSVRRSSPKHRGRSLTGSPAALSYYPATLLAGVIGVAYCWPSSAGSSHCPGSCSGARRSWPFSPRHRVSSAGHGTCHCSTTSAGSSSTLPTSLPPCSWPASPWRRRRPRHFVYEGVTSPPDDSACKVSADG